MRPAVLFNYVGPSTLNADFLRDSMEELGFNKPSPPLSQAKLDKRGFLSFVFDGRYKFTRHYAPSAFNTPRTLEEIFANNDVQLFDLQSDPDEMHNLALEPQKNRETILRTLTPIEPPWYGPVCPVVWEGRRREASPYPDHRRFLDRRFLVVRACPSKDRCPPGTIPAKAEFDDVSMA